MNGFCAERYREFTEEKEQIYLSQFAQLSINSKGREKEIAPCEMRTVYQRDRDRIIHCKSFRRLKHKTQVFLSLLGDHYRTRLTHTLEVGQIARTIARALRLNEDLTEAIAMGHDLGHTPFGHSGEEVLQAIVPGGFEHNQQSLRVVEKLENDGAGLNLTYEVRDGILNHNKNASPSTLEGCVVSIADRIAYVNHDIDDAVRAKILLIDDLPKNTLDVLGSSHGERINLLIRDVVNQSFMQPWVRMSHKVDIAFNELRDFMFERVYLNTSAKREEGKAKHVVRALYEHTCSNIGQLPKEFVKNINDDGCERVAADWIACMTDRYAIDEYQRLFVPRTWP